MADLAAYRPIKREALCGPYPHLYRLRAAAAVERSRALELLGLLERTDIARRGPTIRKPGSCSPRRAG